MNEAILSRNHVKVKGSGKASIMFAPGFGCDQSVWNAVAPAFEEDHRVILFDYVGSGHSDLRAYDLNRYQTLDGYAQDVLDVCEALDLEETVFGRSRDWNASIHPPPGAFFPAGDGRAFSLLFE